jgi:hypothetical protein
LGHEVRGFAWVGGEEWSYSQEAAERIRAAGFGFSFMTNNAVIRPGAELLQVHRTNVEAHFDPALMRLCLSGFYDVLYLPKRRRVNRLTAARAACARSVAAGVEIAEVTEGDLETLARFLTRKRRSGRHRCQCARRASPSLVPVREPGAAAGVPRGWVARDKNGEMVAQFCAAERFQCDGAVYTLLMGGGFYVSASHRGLGLMLRVYLELGKRHALFASTMNEVSGALYERYGGYAVPNTEHGTWACSAMRRWSRFLARRFGRPGLARIAATAAALRRCGARRTRRRAGPDPVAR